jgi:hypothetical protein
MIYQLYKAGINKDTDAAMSINTQPQVSFLFDPANTDYANFKKDLTDGAELLDSEGVIMTEEQINQFIETLS